MTDSDKIDSLSKNEVAHVNLPADDVEIQLDKAADAVKIDDLRPECDISAPSTEVSENSSSRHYPHINLGYCCLNETLRARKPSIYTNRTMIKKTFLSKGLPYVSQLALQNVKDLLQVFKWNEDHNIRLFRVSSDMFAFWSEYELEDLPDFDAIKDALRAAGDYATEHEHRITAHPGPYTVLASPNDEVARKSIIELERHSQIFDLMGFKPSYYNKINIHTRGVYDSKIKAMDRFAERFEKVSDNCRRRLCVENDDIPSAYSIDDLMYLHEKIGIPITFDKHHQLFCKGKMTDEEAFHAAIKTWPEGIKPIVHYSESQAGRKPLAHSDYVVGPIDFYGCNDLVQCHIESKRKDLALLRYRDEIARLSA